jgi:hypothetical protein
MYPLHHTLPPLVYLYLQLIPLVATVTLGIDEEECESASASM